MLNSNFNLRTFLTESKNPTLSEGAKFKVGDMVKLSGGEPTEVLAVRKMTGSDLHAYSIKNSKGERAEYDETQLTAADVSEVLSEATVMEYIRERMTEMNNEVRSCMREYLQRCNEIDPGHEDAHAQLMGALEDFYNKLKAHFEADAMEDPMPGDEEPPVVLPSDAPSRELDGSPMIEGEEEEEAFGGEEDELEERAYFDPYDELEESENEDMVDEDHSADPTDKYVVRPCKNKDEPWAVWEGETRVKGFATKEEAQEFADTKNKEQGLDEGAINEDAGIYQGLVDTAMNMGSERDTALFLAGLVKTVVHLGAVPALVAALYPFKDKPVVQKLLAKLEKFVDAD